MSSPPRKCLCHDEPMEWTGGKKPFWRCVIIRRELQRRRWHEKRKHDPLYKLDRQLREMARVRIRY